MSQDKKISELDTILSALDGTEQVAIVQGGVTYKGTVANILTYITGQNLSLSGTLSMAVAGKTLSIRSGTNQRAGNAVLVGGTVDVANATVTANSLILLSRKTIGGAAGNLSYTLTAGTKFTINSSSGTDTSTVSYFIIEIG